MLTNKWVLFGLSLAVTVVGYLSTVDWQTLLPSGAGTIVMVIGVIKMILNGLMPPVGQGVITSTGGTIITHT